MNNESFEEFYKKQVLCEQYALSYDSEDMEIIRNHYERSKANMKETWVHQQKKIQELENIVNSIETFGISQSEKIDKLEKENEELKKLLGEAVDRLDCFCEGPFGTCDYCNFLSKPEIQKYLSEGEG